MQQSFEHEVEVTYGIVELTWRQSSRRWNVPDHDGIIQPDTQVSLNPE